MFDFDTSDQLIAAQPRRADQAVDRELSGLPAGSRLAVVDLGALNDHTELTPLYQRCLPGDDSNIERNRRRDQVMAPIHKRLGELANRPEATSSPIIESLLDIAQDRELNAPGTRLTVVLVTDGLQATSYASAYNTKPWPEPKLNLLQNVDVRLVLLRNERDFSLQRAGVAHLLSWLRAARAQVDYQEPTWLSLAKGGAAS